MNRGLIIGSGSRLGGLGAFGLPMGGGTAVTYSISGTVYDANGSTAVQSATVALGAYSASSATDGTYTISGIAPGTSGSMTCSKTGYSWTAIAVAAMSGDLTAQNYTNAWWAGGGCAAACVAAYRGLGAASQAASYVNLANPGTNDLTVTDAPTWNTATGWTFTNTQYLKTGLSALNIVAAVVKVTARTSGDQFFGAVDTPAAKYFYIYYYAPNGKDYYANGGENGYAGTDTGAFGFAGTRAYYNGADVGAVDAGNGRPDVEIWIGKYKRQDNIALGSFVGTITSCAFYSSAPTAGQMASVMAANP